MMIPPQSRREPRVTTPGVIVQGEKDPLRGSKLRRRATGIRRHIGRSGKRGPGWDEGLTLCGLCKKPSNPDPQPHEARQMMDILGRRRCLVEQRSRAGMPATNLPENCCSCESVKPRWEEVGGSGAQTGKIGSATSFHSERLGNMLNYAGQRVRRNPASERRTRMVREGTQTVGRQS